MVQLVHGGYGPKLLQLILLILREMTFEEVKDKIKSLNFRSSTLQKGGPPFLKGGWKGGKGGPPLKGGCRFVK